MKNSDEWGANETGILYRMVKGIKADLSIERERERERETERERERVGGRGGV